MEKKRRRKPKFPVAGGLIAIVAVVLAAAVAAWWFTPAKSPSVQVYFFKADKPFAVSRPLLPDQAPLEVAISELLKGPSDEEKLVGLSSQLPAGIKVRMIKTERDVAIIDFNGRLEAYGGGSTRVEGLVAQIVYTATAVPGISKTWIWLAGEKEVVLGGEGLVLDKPLSRGDLVY